MLRALLAPALIRTLAVAGISGLWAIPAWAIVAGHVDNFNDGTTQDWRIGSPSVFPVNQPDFGPAGAGDHSLWMATAGAGGSTPNLVVFNISSDWTGDWTEAGVARVELDVLGPSSNSFPLAMRLGIAGPSPPGPFGGGNTFVTDAIQVPSDNQWHRITFDVLDSDFTPVAGNNINSALASVAHFRILHNPVVAFTGANTSFGGGEFYLDNITALAATPVPTSTGDYNRNGVVDAADYVLWRETLNQTVATPGDGADGNLNGMIDSDDYQFWRARFGDVVPIAGRGAGFVAVPEPAAALLFASSAVVPWPRRRRVA